MEKNNEVLLKVDHLCQYFRLGHRDMKAVDDVSFEVRKGEAFGLVGESGCGKTTTGRSIIKLYDITSGNVYFKGKRIGAGTRAYKDAIEAARTEAKSKIKLLRAEKDVTEERAAQIRAEIEEINTKLNAVLDENKAKIREAKTAGREVDREYAANLVKALEVEYSDKMTAEFGDLLEANNTDPSEALANEADIVKTGVSDLAAGYTATLIKEAKKKLAAMAQDSDPAVIEARKATLKAIERDYKNRSRVAKRSRLITQIQMIFQDPIASLDPRMTVRDIIAEGLIINGITDKEYINNKVYEILETVGLVREHADRYPHEFSGGQRQRIGIARAVVMQPEMIIADEPISALDVSIQAQVINLLNDLRERLGLTIMFIAHDLSVVKYFSDRIGVMYFGKMVELADSDELFKHPLHPYTKSLLSAIPLPDPVYEKQRTRITYNPLAEHDYSTNGPSFREVAPGHFVYCNDAEEEKYKQILSEDTEG